MIWGERGGGGGGRERERERERDHKVLIYFQENRMWRSSITKASC